jgi:hypothetical protein
MADLKHLDQNVRGYEDSAKHLKSAILLAMLGTVNTASQLSKAHRQQKHQYEGYQESIRPF